MMTEAFQVPPSNFLSPYCIYMSRCLMLTAEEILDTASRLVGAAGTLLMLGND